MRVLFVTPYVPSLIRPRALNLVRQICRGNDVTVVALAAGDNGEGDALRQLRECCEDVYVFPNRKPQAVLNCLLHAPSRMPLQAAYTLHPECRRLIAEISHSGRFDVLHVEHIRAAHLADGVDHLPRVYDSVDCITSLLKQKLLQGTGPFGKALGYEELLKMRTYEPETAAAFDSVIITSEHDRRALQHLMRRNCRTRRTSGGRMQTTCSAPYSLPPVTVVPNGVDSEYFRPIDGVMEPGTIVFSGKMSYFPNVTAVTRFCREVLPRIRRRRPDVRFRIVGSDPPAEVQQLAADPSVEVTGYVPDIRPLLASAQVVVCPLTVGVGIQNKVLEAMSMARPVVASPIACSGIPDAVDGRHLIRAERPDEIADSVLRLLDNPDYAMSVADSARRLVTDSYSWEASARSLMAIYLDAVEARSGRIPVAA